MDLSFKLHPSQLDVFNHPARFKGIAAGRRWGKSFLARDVMLINGLKNTNPDMEIYYVAPTFEQGKKIMWDRLKSKAQPVTKSIHENTGVLTLINGTKLNIKGSDRPDTLRGVGLLYVVLDEFAFMKPEVWELIIYPTLLDCKGGAMFIGTPDGKNHFFDLQIKTLYDPEWKWWNFPSKDNPFLDPKEIEKSRQNMSSQAFRQEFEASFESFGAGVFQEDWLDFIEPDEPEPEGHIYLAVDPAGFSDIADEVKTKNPRLNETAIAVVKVHLNGWRVKEIIYGRWNIRETSLRILRAAQKYRAVCIGIEGGALKNALGPYMQDQMRRLGIFPHIVELRHGGKSKIDRIVWSLQGRFEHGRIQLEKGDWNRKFTQQYLDFPNPLVFDDLLDALAYVDQLAISPYSQDFETDNWEPLDIIAGY